MNKFQLDNKFKKIGYIISIGTFIFMIIRKFIENSDEIKPVLHGVLLLGLLLVSLSKDKFEDEFLDSLRSQSYRIAFILVIIYSLIQPIINYTVGIILNQDEEMKAFGYFQILFFMLIVQLMVFWQLKKMNN
ncbi:hypothetical protein [Polaribacter ponticola]|uniref:Uncharacterized protein n=1 Tax=Polaribacter ponticola TaxID=2978475 RepID=A0ABT5S7E6_9FLAO|nr:hypothetical protein [Polaribacter sp. MSW5]MDD7913998.1 hypothetical protein [Polaribacter sp. MSW5]